MVFLFLIPFILVFVTADFPIKKQPLGRDVDFPQSLTENFSGVRNPNPVSDDQNYALNFLIKEALLGQDIDFRLSLIRGVLCNGGFREIKRRFDLLVGDNLSANFVENQYLRPKSASLVRKLSA